MGAEEQNTPVGERLDEVRAKLERGEELTPEEQEFLRGEGLELPGEGPGPPAV